MPITTPVHLPEAEQHAAVELFRGVMTHHEVIIAYRNDRPSPAQPVRFSADAWRCHKRGLKALRVGSQYAGRSWGELT